MRCDRTELLILESELGLLAPAAERELRSHLAGCARCAALESSSRRLRQDLSSLCAEPPFEVDLSPRVLQHLPALDPVDREAVPVRQLGWAALSAVAAGVALVVAAWPFASQLRDGARQAIELASSLADAAAGFTRPLARVGVALAAALGSVLDSLLLLLETAEPIAAPFVVAGSLAMAATIVVVVGRDLKDVPPKASRGEAT